ncbi:NADP-dependent malic enzyme, partial [archaeon]
VKDTESFVNVVKSIAPSFGAINLEDIESPRCFEIFDALNGKIGIPVFHDDRQGTGMVTTAALINSLKILGKKIDSVKIVIAGAGAAGYGIIKLLKAVGAQNIIVTDSKGIIYQGREGLTKYKQELADVTNREKIHGTLADALKGADVVIAASAVKGLVTKEMVKSMNADPIVFALSNPDPEIFPTDAKEAGAAIVATGRGDFPNQINNVLVFPGAMRGVLDANASIINEEMMVSGIHALADIVKDEMDREHILPAANDKRILPAVSNAVREAAVRTGVARNK